MEVDAQYPKKLHELHRIYHFYLKEQKLKKDEKLVANIYDEKNMS